VRFEVFTVMTMKIVVFWHMMPCSLVDTASVSEGCVACICMVEQSLFYLEDESRMFLQNVRTYSSVP
jgi:hypothetical protein